MNWWRMEKAAGDGRDRGSTGMFTVVGPPGIALGSRGRVAQWDARTREWTGKIMRCSFPDGDFDADTASACVG